MGLWNSKLVQSHVKLSAVSVKYVAIVANAAIHCEVIIDFKLSPRSSLG
jgi:hypothetical protein